MGFEKCRTLRITLSLNVLLISLIMRKPAYPGAEVLVHVVRRHRGVLLRQVPELQRHVVPAQDVPPVTAERDVRDAGDNLREEGLVGLNQVQRTATTVLNCIQSSFHAAKHQRGHTSTPATPAPQTPSSAGRRAPRCACPPTECSPCCCCTRTRCTGAGGTPRK